MKCKFCLAEIEDGLETCPVCGKSLAEQEEISEETPVEETAEEVVAVEPVAEEPVTEEPVAEEAVTEEPVAEKKKPKAWKIVLAVASVLVLAVVLTGVILHAMGLSKTVLKKLGIGVENDIYRKDSYTVEMSVLDKKSDAVVATLGNQTLTNSELQIYYWTTVDYFVRNYGSYMSYMGVDLSKPLDELVYDEKTGMTYQQMLLENAIASWREDAVLLQAAEEAGFTLSQVQQSELDSFSSQMEELAKEYQYDSVDAFISEEFVPGINKEVYYNYNKDTYTAFCYYLSLYPTEDAVAAYYQEHEAEFVEKKQGKDAGNYYDVRHILVAIEGEANDEGEYTDAQWEACRAKAQKMLDDFLAGEATEDAFAALATSSSADPGSASKGGLYEKLTKDYGFIEEFENWYLEEGRKQGDTGLVKNTQSSVQGYHIMYYVGDMPIWFHETQTVMVSQITDKLLEEAEEKWPIAADYAKMVLGKVETTN